MNFSSLKSGMFTFTSTVFKGIFFLLFASPRWKQNEKWEGTSPRGAIAEMLDCDIVESEFEPQSFYYVPFRTNILLRIMNPFIPTAMGWSVSQLFFYVDGFDIKYPRKVEKTFKKTLKLKKKPKKL